MLQSLESRTCDLELVSWRYRCFKRQMRWISWGICVYQARRDTEASCLASCLGGTCTWLCMTPAALRQRLPVSNIGSLTSRSLSILESLSSLCSRNVKHALHFHWFSTNRLWCFQLILITRGYREFPAPNSSPLRCVFRQTHWGRVVVLKLVSV